MSFKHSAMVRISQEMILKYASHTKQRTNESDPQYLKRLTHIYFQERSIDEISNLSLCKNISVLYLYDNNIEVIKNLDFACHLTHLYLQKNNIRRISGLKKLHRLTKLYLGQNAITVVEGLEENCSLAELHIEGQKLPPGEKLLFDPRSLEVLSHSLTVLNISSNNIDVISDLKCLRSMSHFMAEDNCLSDLSDLAEALLEWPSLSKLDIAGNPLCEKKKFRDKIIIMSKSLVMIDGKEVSESTRQFLKNWYANKEAKKQQRKTSKDSGGSFDYVDLTNPASHINRQYPYSYDTLNYAQDSRLLAHDAAPRSSKHLSKQHQQFAEILARSRTKAKQLPPLEQQRPRMELPASDHRAGLEISRIMQENRPTYNGP